MNTILQQRIQYIKDADKVSTVLNLQAAYERLYDVLPIELKQAIDIKIEEFKIEDENEI